MKRFLFLILCFIFLLPSTVFAQRKYSHWSLNLKGGISRGEYSSGRYGTSLGAEIEGSFNPLWGIFAEYEFNQYIVSQKLSGTGNEITVQAGINLLNLLSKHRSGNWQRLHAYFRMGGGVTLYNTETTGYAFVIPASGALEYNLSQHLSLGIIGEHRWYSSSTLGFKNEIQERPILWSIMGSVRVKFVSSRGLHIRDMKVTTYDSQNIYLP